VGKIRDRGVPGAKFLQWERSGVPVVLELGVSARTGQRQIVIKRARYGERRKGGAGGFSSGAVKEKTLVVATTRCRPACTGGPRKNRLKGAYGARKFTGRGRGRF